MPATQLQSKYITDLAVRKTKEFKEVKELLVSSAIVSADAEIIANAGTIDDINYHLTEQQASAFIDALTATQDPARGRVYSKKRIEKATALVDDIKETISRWDFS